MADASTCSVDTALVLDIGKQDGILTRHATIHKQGIVNEKPYLWRIVILKCIIIETADDERVAIPVCVHLIIRSIIIYQALAIAIGYVSRHNEVNLEPTVYSFCFPIEYHTIPQIEMIDIVIGICRAQCSEFRCLVVNRHMHHTVKASGHITV